MKPKSTLQEKVLWLKSNSKLFINDSELLGAMNFDSYLEKKVYVVFEKMVAAGLYRPTKQPEYFLPQVFVYIQKAAADINYGKISKNHQRQIILKAKSIVGDLIVLLKAASHKETQDAQTDAIRQILDQVVTVDSMIEAQMENRPLRLPEYQ